MAIVKGLLKMTGGVEDLSFYTREGSDQVIMRAKGGPSALRMKIGPEFINTRKHQVEWKACVKFSKSLRNAVGETYRLGDSYISSKWNGLGKNLLELDKEHPVGERNILLSLYRKELENLPMNRNYPFTSVLRVPVEYEIDKQTMVCTVKLPRIITAQDLFNFRKLPHFRVIVSIGIIGDILYDPDSRQGPYISDLNEYTRYSTSLVTGWLSTNDIIEPQTLTIQAGPGIIEKMTSDTSVLISIGVEFGSVGFGGQINPVKRAGSAMIVCSR